MGVHDFSFFKVPRKWEGKRGLLLVFCRFFGEHFLGWGYLFAYPLLPPSFYGIEFFVGTLRTFRGSFVLQTCHPKSFSGGSSGPEKGVMDERGLFTGGIP